MIIGKIKVSACGWPWQHTGTHWANRADKTAHQKWGWNPFKVKGMGRFGGGWAFKLGITASSNLKDWVIDLGIGSIRINKVSEVKK